MMRFIEVVGLSVLLLSQGINCFQSATTVRRHTLEGTNILEAAGASSKVKPTRSALFASKDDGKITPLRKRDALKRIFGKFKGGVKNVAKRPLSVAVGVAILTSAATTIKPNAAHASAPVMALPKAEGRDPASEAIMEYDRKMTAKAQQDLNEMSREARRIEAEQGEAARVKYEKEFKARQQKEADDRKAGLETLKRELLDKGLCPFTDLEGQRQVMLYTKGVDLGEVPGTQFYLEKEFERSAFKKSIAFKKANNRKIVACMVQDMKNRGIDPLDYFEKHQDQTEAIFDLSAERASRLLSQYEENLEKYGQILPPKEGEKSAKELMAEAPAKNDPGAQKAAKDEAKRIKEEEKARAKALKEEQKEAKAKAAAEAKAAKEAEKKANAEEKQRVKEAAQAEKLAAASAAAAAAAAVGSSSAAAEVADMIQESTTAVIEEVVGEEQASEEAVSTDSLKSSELKTITVAGKEVPAAAAGAAGVVVVAGGGVAFKLYKDKVAKDEEERKRQLRLLMGGGKDTTITPASAPALEEIDVDMDDPKTKKPKESKVETPAPAPAPVPKKRKIGIKSVFGKKKNARETDLMVLVSDDAAAPQFTKTLAKMLTFGAPGRFPAVISLPGGMPMETFELEEAKTKLTEAQTEAGLSLEESAEVFANVVNCMLIDIVDLASASLKEKEEKMTVDAINVVVDFMNHAASLYDSIAEGVSITPVTYGGDLSKSKLEQMYSAYAVSGMMNMDSLTEDFDSRVAMLQDVFQISEKKAEGLMMKAMQKNMMKMMKDGEGMEGMEEMMKAMGGLEGMPPGLGGADGEGPSPEQLKEMLTALKQMKDSGSIPPDEFDNVKKQFKEAFGSSIDDVVKEASANNEELSQTDKELLELMKSIMDD